MHTQTIRQTNANDPVIGNRKAYRDLLTANLLKINASSYSMKYKIAETISLSADPNPRNKTVAKGATPDQEPAPATTPAQAGPVPRFDDDFFEAAFEGLTETMPADAALADSQFDDSLPGPLKGYLEDCSPERIAGWAQDSRPGAPPVRLAIMLDKEVLAHLRADSWRADLRAASIGAGHHAFEFRPVQPIPRNLLGRVRVIRVADQAELPRVFDIVHQVA